MRKKFCNIFSINKIEIMQKERERERLNWKHEIINLIVRH